ncbi:hypothetical protein CA265_04305 [Sphingobacteriaceae bacterium GW460-11-11-14-LB5]|nr:hypothetical protein CA265_04305 [Sphingobacteriaceae bacterium GW460-11-11-14-LB5]
MRTYSGKQGREPPRSTGPSLSNKKSLRLSEKPAGHYKQASITGANFGFNIKRSFYEKIGNCYLFKGFEIVALGKFCSK